MNTRAVTAAIAAAAIAWMFGCGGKDAKDKPATAAAAPDTVAAVPDTAAVAPDTATTFTDKRDGKVYKIVKIGRQTWFAENLNYDTARSVCYDNKAENCAKYGRLYNWETALKACPAGTHLPTDDEWKTLVDYSGVRKKAGTKLKSSTGWNSYKDVPTGTDEYGFSALPGGGSNTGIRSHHPGSVGYWWSATAWDDALIWYMGAGSEGVIRDNGDKINLFSVRCVLNDEKDKQI